MARLTHSNLLLKELKARSQISSSKPSNACQEPTKSLKQRQISRVSASLCSRKVGREIPRLSNPRHNSKAGLRLLPLPPRVVVKILEPSAYQFRETTSKFSYRKTAILWAPSLLQARARRCLYNPYHNFNKRSPSSTPNKHPNRHIPGKQISIV